MWKLPVSPPLQSASALPDFMKPQSARFPFSQSRRCARWPADIPLSERRLWKGQRKSFSAIWRVPAGTGFDTLRIELARRFMVILVRRGTILLSHGDTHYQLQEGQAVAISVGEVLAQVPDCPVGDCIFEIHLIHRMPTPGKLGVDTVLGRMVAAQSHYPAGIFPYPNASALNPPVQPGGEGVESPTALLSRLYLCGIASTVAFVASCQVIDGAGVVGRIDASALAWEDLPEQVVGLAW
jgi:hypothetical protein